MNKPDNLTPINTLTRIGGMRSAVKGGKVSAAQRKAIQTGVALPLVKPDIDNVVKVVMIALNGVAYHDDKQVVRQYAEKRYIDGEPYILQYRSNNTLKAPLKYPVSRFYASDMREEIPTKDKNRLQRNSRQNRGIYRKPTQVIRPVWVLCCIKK